MSRREFVRNTGMAAAALAAPIRPRRALHRSGDRPDTPVAVHCVKEVHFQSSVVYADPYNDVDVDVIATAPDGSQRRIPAFSRGKAWTCRFSASVLGEHTLVTECTNPEDAGLHQQKVTVRVEPYAGGNPLYRHGRLRVGADKRRLEHVDGTPFLWIGDTWWMGLSSRLKYPDDFERLTDDRVDKGFNVIQIIAGPYPDMDTWDPRGRNEAGFPFRDDLAGVHFDYYDSADVKLRHLVESGLMPCIVGMWGYYLPRLGVDKAKRFWRYLVARYGAYPVAWCICGEGTMPYYLSETREQDAAAQKAGWTEVMRYVREIDPYRNVISIHPTQYGHAQVEDASLMDFDMLQTGHGDIDSIPNVISSMRTAIAHEPKMPVINSEVNYEGIMGRCWQNVIRLAFYHSMMNGAAGFTYGANGIWQVNERDRPYGPSPHGRSWGHTPWDEAMALPGSRQVGIGGRFFSRFPWWELQHQPDWYDKSKKENDPYGTIAVGIPGKLRIYYSPNCWNPPVVKALEPGLVYNAWYFDPVTGAELALGSVRGNAEGRWTPPFPPEVHDWIVVLEAA